MQSAPLLGCHCWAPLWGQWLDAIAQCHCRMLATNSSGVHVGCHCWAPLLGPIAWVPLFGAIAGCHCWRAIAGCHCGVPWLAAIAGLPLRETIARKKSPECYTVLRCPFLCIDNAQKLAGAIWGLCWYNYYSFLTVHCLIKSTSTINYLLLFEIVYARMDRKSQNSCQPYPKSCWFPEM